MYDVSTPQLMTVDRKTSREEADALDLLSTLGITLTPILRQLLKLHPRELMVIGGWRAGKSTILSALMFVEFFRAVLSKRAGLFWLVGPDYAQTNEEFRYMAEWSQKLGLIRESSSPQEGSKRLVLEGGVVLETKSGTHYERLGSVAPDMIGVCEAGQVSEDVRDMIRGRAAEKRARVIYTGTLEDDESHARWVWYQEAAMNWLDGAKCDSHHDCASEHYSVSLPSWDNRIVFPGGEQDDEIVRLKELYKDIPFTFARRYAAIPTGVQWAVYPQALVKQGKLLRRMSDVDIRAPVIGGYGGIDFGTVHPSVLVVGHLIEDVRDRQVSFVGPKGILWVREVRWFRDDPGDAFKLQKARKELSDRWKIWRWNVDPNERYMAKSFQASATSYSTSAREARVSILSARLNLDKIYFDQTGPGVPELYEQLKRIHRRKTASGELQYVRNDDDGVAACEDMVEAVDGQPLQAIGVKMGTRVYPKQRRRSEFTRRG